MGKIVCSCVDDYDRLDIDLMDVCLLELDTYLTSMCFCPHYMGGFNTHFCSGLFETYILLCMGVSFYGNYRMQFFIFFVGLLTALCI